MYLKRVTTQGFKSFATRTSFEFGRGITAVVGPNGSGKSNVADAIRWVLGEQSVRLLRARKAEDVIFAGAKDRAPVGMAEVLLTLDNDDRWLPLDFAEVEIGRRLFRNGESEYLLNGSRVRLKDVTDLLLKADVGQNSYTILGQGLVDEVLTMTPDERRSFLDEAADVKRFRMKIKEAEDRLAATTDNLDRARLIVAELEPRLGTLRRQAERAGEHARLSAELRELLRLYYGQRWSEAQNALVRARAALDQASAEDGTATGRVDGLRDQLRALGEEIRKRRETIARQDQRRQEGEGRQRALAQALTLDRERQAVVASRMEELRHEISSIEAERASDAAETTAGAPESAGSEQDQTAAALEEARAFVQRSRETLDAAERASGLARTRLHELRDAGASDVRRRDQATAEIDAASERLGRYEREAEGLGARRQGHLVELIGFGRRFNDARLRFFDAEDALTAAQQETGQLRVRLQQVEDDARQAEHGPADERRELDRLEGRLEALQRMQAELDSVAAGTREVLTLGERDAGGRPAVPGVLGMLAHFLRVPSGLEIAINAALEQRLHAIVVESEEAGLRAIGALLGRQQGRAQILPLDSLRPIHPVNLQKERGVVGVASKLVRCENRFRPLVDTLLGRVIVVEDLPTGLRMLRRGLGTVVTLDGTVVEPFGAITGGASGAEGGVFTRNRELDELPARVAELRSRTAVSGRTLEDARRAIDNAAGAVREAEAHEQSARIALDDVRAAILRERDLLARLTRELRATHARLADLTRDELTETARLLQARQVVSAVEGRVAERDATAATLEAELQTALADREVALRAVADASARLGATDAERRTLLALREQRLRAAQRFDAQLESRRTQLRNVEAEAVALATRVAAAAAELDTLNATHEDHNDAEPDRHELVRLENHERTVQEELNNAQASLLAVDRRRLDLEAEVARAQGEIELLRNELAQEGLAPGPGGQIVPLDEVVATAGGGDAGLHAISGAAELDLEELRGRIDELRRQIRRLGPVNQEAFEDFRETDERYSFLTGQMDDLTQAEVQLREAIGQLNEEIRERFTAAFDKVAVAFSEYFTSFFGGGAGQLLLSDPDNPASSGVEIEAQPPGKRVKSLTLLSGGERSLTAVALLFALLTVNPAPFCVLDEVDAALDEANVGRFSAALEGLSEKTQFIVITHNRRTIEASAAIYGVSMGRDGVSKTLSLKLGDLPQQ